MPRSDALDVAATVVQESVPSTVDRRPPTEDWQSSIPHLRHEVGVRSRYYVQVSMWGEYPHQPTVGPGWRGCDHQSLTSAAVYDEQSNYIPRAFASLDRLARMLQVPAAGERCMKKRTDESETTGPAR